MPNFYNNEIENEYSKKTDVKYLRSLGQFFTPIEVASFMSDWILDNDKRNLKILDPATGFGIFERALSHCNEKEKKNLYFDLWEIDENISRELSKVVANLNIRANILTGDFLLSPWERRYDGIIANPPYYKHHHIENKGKVYQNICLNTSFRFSIQTNIYCWFLIKSINLLRPGGRLAFIVPSEFFNANYGEKVKTYLIHSGVVIHLINVNFKKTVFHNALTTSVIILGENSKSRNKVVNFYNINDVAEITCLPSFLDRHPRKSLSANNLDPKSKWRNYFTILDKGQKRNNLIPFAKLGRFCRGIATGANDYFTLCKKEIKDNSIPNNCLTPCITKAYHVRDIRFTSNDFKQLLETNKKVYLFDGEKSNDSCCVIYIKSGESKGINTRYLTKNRNPWFALEKRDVSKIWVSVFGRKGLKFVWNDTDCLTLTCFHNFYPTNLGRKYIDILFLYLNTDFAKGLLEREKREYGNGLGKFEPNDINKALVLDFDRLPNNVLDEMKVLQEALLSSDGEQRQKIKKQADDIFRKAFQSAEGAGQHQCPLFHH